MTDTAPTSAMRVAITGASGFIGTNAVDYCLDKGCEVINLDIRPPRKSDQHSNWREVDIRDKDLLETTLKEFKPTHILNLAAKTGMDETDMTVFAANTDGVRHLIEIGKELPSLEHIVFTSSLLVCHNGYIPKSDTDYCPPNLYGESKMVGEQIVREADPLPFKWSIVRPTSIWGPWFELSYRSFFLSVNRGVYLHPGRKPVIKPVSYVGNTVHMMFTLFREPTQMVDRQTFYLADYPQNSIQEWADTIQRTLKVGKVRAAPMWLMKTIALGGDTLKLLGWKNPPLTSFRLNNMLTGGDYPVEKIQQTVGDLPFNLQGGVEETVKWMRDEGDIG